MAVDKIAQLIVPDDGGGNPQLIVPDWKRGVVYFVGRLMFRKYKLALVTQVPMRSTPMASQWCHGADVDPITGQLLVQQQPNAGLTNACPIAKFDPNSFEKLGSYGHSTSFPNWPSSFWAGDAVVCLTAGKIGGGLQGYTLFKESEFSGAVGVIFTDRMDSAGFHQQVVVGSVDNRGFMCRGRSGSGMGSVFLTWSTTSPEPILPVYTVEIQPGAEAYIETGVGGPNLYITQRVVVNLAASDVDPTWTNIACDKLGYDITDDSIIMLVYAGGSSDMRLIKLASSNGAVIWSSVYDMHSFGEIDLNGLSISQSTIGLIREPAYGSVNTNSGVITSLGPMGGVDFNDFLMVNNQQGQYISSPFGNLFFALISWYRNTYDNAPQPVAGTPPSLDGAWVMLGTIVPKIPPEKEKFFNFLACCDRGIMAHLYQFTSATGESDYFTDFDLDINWGGALWKSGSLRFEGLQRKVSVGLNVDEQSLKIWANPTDTLFGGNFLTGALQGVLDGAIVIRRRIIWAFITGNVAVDMLQPPVIVWTLYSGYTSAISKGGVSHVELKVRSALVKLNVNMPRNYYQPGCLWTLYDKGCSLNKAAYGVNGTVSMAMINAIGVAGGITPAVGADGIANFAQGRLVFTSGVNAGLQVLVDNNDGNNLYLAYSLDNLPNIGDAITYYPGCSKAYGTCMTKFNNQYNFRGFDKVPPVLVSL